LVWYLHFHNGWFFAFPVLPPEAQPPMRISSSCHMQPPPASPNVWKWEYKQGCAGVRLVEERTMPTGYALACNGLSSRALRALGTGLKACFEGKR
jgi:hypothetical protein